MSNVNNLKVKKVNIMETVSHQTPQILGFSVWGIPDFFKKDFSENIKKAC